MVSPLRALALLVASGAVWGLSFTLSRIVASGGGSPIAIAFWQAAFGAGLLWAFGRRPPRDRRALQFFALAGVLGAALPSALIYTAARHVSAGALAVCMALVPLATFGFCAALGIDRVAARRLGGLALGLAAVWLLVSPEDGAPLGWTLLAVGAACSYASENVWLALRRPPASGAFETLCGILTAGAIALAPLALATGRPWPFAWPLGAPETAFGVQSLGNLLAYGGFVHLLGKAGPVFASQVAYVVTAAGVAWGAALLGERHDALFWLALALMAAGLALTLPRPAAPDWTRPRPSL